MPLPEKSKAITTTSNNPTVAKIESKAASGSQAASTIKQAAHAAAVQQKKLDKVK